MKPLSETYKELGLAFSFPIIIKDANGKLTYCENSEGRWYKWKHDENGKETYYENSDGFWYKYHRDSNGRETYYENSYGYWYKCERDANGRETYYEDSDGDHRGTPKSAKTCEGKTTLTMNTQNTINNVRAWGEGKGITGPNGTATGVTQFRKTLEEIEELSDAIEAHDLPEIKDAIGDTGVTLILLAERYGMTFEDCLETAYQVISKRTGKMVNGVFVKDK